MYLGIDLGTSELKAILLSEAHRVEASARASLTISRPRPMWSEQDPQHWWLALEAALDQLAASQPQAMRQVRGIGLSGQMHGAVLLDRARQPLRPAILWNDGRSFAQCEQLTREVPELTAIAGNLAMPGFTAPKLLWVREHEPEVFARLERILLPKDYLRLRLSGEAFTDCSDASGTLWLDVGRREWSATLLRACGLDAAQMPALAEGNAPAGALLGQWARRWGLTEGVPVAAGGGDNAASAVGIGAVQPGQGFVSLGTSGVVFVVSDRFRPNPAEAMHAFCHALPGRWHQMSVMLSAASCLDWAARLTGAADVAQLVARAATLSPAQRGSAPLFLPYLSGERTPHNDPAAQGVLFGLTHEHDDAALAWAVLEGVGFGLRDGLRSIDPAGKSAPESLVLVGGGARSALWAQMLADILGIPLEQREGAEAGAALGAARLGWMASGASVEQACAAPPIVRRWFEPRALEQAVHDARHHRFRALYPSLRERFEKQDLGQ
jgi:xylulokinase